MPMADQCKVIAVVDDDPTFQKAIASLLTSYGFATRVFASAEAFLDSHAANEAACLVLDIHLSGMSGLELRQRLKAGGSQLPVIFITAADDAIQTQATKAGCVACLHKPFAADSLISAINLAIGAGFRREKWDCE